MAFDVSGVVAQLGETGEAAAVIGAAVLLLGVGIKSFHLIQDALIVARASREYEEDERQRWNG